MTVRESPRAGSRGCRRFPMPAGLVPAGEHNAAAFVLQGGGSLSAGQVGMLQALTEAGIEPDLVGGSSAGAWNAVAFATAG